jgi:subtilisin-like proprotein convertase family protein
MGSPLNGEEGGEHMGSPLQQVGAEALYRDANRIEYQRGDISEWYVNGEEGLEQGFTIVALPVGQPRAAPLQIDLALSGDLGADLTTDRTAIEFTTSDGRPVLRYGDVRATDASGRALAARLAIRHTRLAILVDASAAAYPITLAATITGLSPTASSGLSTSRKWTAEGDQEGASFGYSVSTAGDVNGDGYSDVIVGAYEYDHGEANEGAAFVYHGSPTGLVTATAWFTDGNQADAWFGYSVSTAGDVNGDGYADVIVGARYYDGGTTDEGRATVYHGSASGLSAASDWTAEGDWIYANFGYAVGTAGDVNGDGYTDVIVGAPSYANGQSVEGRASVYHGSASGLSDTPDWAIESNIVNAQLGTAVATAGDVDGDGYADVVVGAPYYTNGETSEGIAFVYHGSASGLGATAAWTAESEQGSAYFGHSVSTAGDVNGDGYADVIVGAYGYDGGQADEGRATVYHGSASGLGTTAAWTAESDQDNALFGRSVSTAGDVNGDGYADVIVGADRYTDGENSEGRAFVYCGSASGLSATADWTAESDQAGAWFGFSVNTAGDVNGDGYADLIVGAFSYDGGETNEGAAFVYHGAPIGLSPTAAWTAESDQASANFGRSVATAGDVNGDGYADVIVGAYRYDNGQADEGAAFVYHGSATGLSTSPDWTAESNWAGARFGRSVAPAGDVNGDGYTDVIVGAYAYSNGQSFEGAAFVYHGSATGLSSTADWTAESNQGGAYFGFSVSTAGDVNGDGYSDVIVGAYSYDNGQTDEGQALVYHGSAIGLSDTANWTAESNQGGAGFGFSVSTTGDVNGDGYSDVMVGAWTYENGQANEGRAFVYHGSSTGLGASPTWTTEGNQGNANFGVSVSTVGDVNGDGYADVIVGAHGYENGQFDEGAAFVYYGSAAGPSATADWMVEGDLAGAFLGVSVSTAGDVNGDGYADVIVGAYQYDFVGASFVYYGSAAGPSTTADWTAEGNQGGAYFGFSVSTAGDANGDGYADVIVGAFYYNGGQTQEGAAFAYYGNGGDGLDLLPRQLRTDGSVHVAPLGLSNAHDAVQLRLTGRSPAGREPVNLQWQVAPLGIPFTATAVISGTSVDWTDSLATGVVISRNVAGLTPFTPYHWRVRLLYRPGSRLGQPAGRWIHVPWNGWTEQDFRTPDEPIAGLAATNDSPTPLGDATTLTATIAAGTNVSYTWAFGDGDTGSGPVVTHTYPAIGVYTAVVTGSNCGSVATATTTVVVDEPIAGLAAANDSPTPLGQATALTATITAGSNVSYTWAFGDGDTGGGAVLAHIYPAVGVYTAVVSASNSVSVVTATTTVTISDAPIAELAAANDSPTLLGQATTLTATITAGSNVSYTWDFGDGEPGNGAVVVHTYPATGTYTAAVTASNSVSVVMTTTLVTITDVPIAGLAATNDGPTAPGQATTLSATITAGSNVTYTWGFGDGTGVAHPHPSGSGLGLTVPDSGCGGGNYLEHTIDVPAWGIIVDVEVTILDLRHGWDADLCIYLRGPDGTQVELSTDNGGNGDDYYLTTFDDEASTPISGGTPPFTGRFQPEGQLSDFDGRSQQGDWTLRMCDNGPTIEGTLNEWSLTITSAMPGRVVTHTYPGTGTYTATVVASNTVSLVTDATTVIVGEGAIAGLSAANDSPTALGQPTTLTATITAGSNVTYTWACGDGDSGSGAVMAHIYPDIGVYPAVVTASNSVNELTASTTVVVDEAIAGLSVFDDSPTALGSATLLTATIATGSHMTYTWAFGDGEFGSGAHVAHTYPAAGEYRAVVTACNSVSELTATATVVVDEAIAGLSAANDSPTALGQPTTLTATITTGSNVTYTWACGDGDSGSGAVMAHIYPDVGVYTAVVTASNSVNELAASTTVLVDEAIAGLSAANDSPTVLGTATLLTATIAVGSNVTYTWACGDGDSGSGVHLAHTYPAAGEYRAVVTACNSVSELTATTTVTIRKAYTYIYLPLVVRTNP